MNHKICMYIHIQGTKLKEFLLYNQPLLLLSLIMLANYDLD